MSDQPERKPFEFDKLLSSGQLPMPVRDLARHALDPMMQCRVERDGKLRIGVPEEWYKGNATIARDFMHTKDRQNKPLDRKYCSRHDDDKHCLAIWLKPSMVNGMTGASLPGSVVDQNMRELAQECADELGLLYDLPHLQAVIFYPDDAFRRKTGNRAGAVVVFVSVPEDKATLKNSVMPHIKKERAAAMLPPGPATAALIGQAQPPAMHVTEVKRLPNYASQNTPERKEKLRRGLLRDLNMADVNLQAIMAQAIESPVLYDIPADLMLQIQTPKLPPQWVPGSAATGDHARQEPWRELLEIDAGEAETDYPAYHALVLWLHPAQRLQLRDVEHPEVVERIRDEAESAPPDHPPTEPNAVDFAENERLDFSLALQERFGVKFDCCPYAPQQEDNPSALIIYADTAEQFDVLSTVQRSLRQMLTDRHRMDTDQYRGRG